MIDPPLVLVVALGCVTLCVTNVFATFNYTIDRTHLTISWRILSRVPFNSRSIRLAAVAQVRRFERFPDHLFVGSVWGNLFVKPGIILTLRKGLFRRIYLTPRQPDEFMRELNARIAQLGIGD